MKFSMKKEEARWFGWGSGARWARRPGDLGAQALWRDGTGRRALEQMSGYQTDRNDYSVAASQAAQVSNAIPT